MIAKVPAISPGVVSGNVSGAASDPAAQKRAVELQLTREQQREVSSLAARDREVRAHEAAHANVGGIYAGAPRYSYQRGPDGNNYAVSGEVSIDTSPIPGDPQATIAKAQIVRRAALAPAQPSPQDRAVASEALAMEQAARLELQREQGRSNETAFVGQGGGATAPGSAQLALQGTLIDTLA